MLASPNILVLFGQAEIDYVHYFGLLTSSNHEVVGLDVSVDEPFSMDMLQPRHDLYSDLQCCRQTEFLITASKVQYQRWNKSSREAPKRSMTIKSRSLSTP